MLLMYFLKPFLSEIKGTPKVSPSKSSETKDISLVSDDFAFAYGSASASAYGSASDSGSFAKLSLAKSSTSESSTFI
jgi:hypothetical protein